MAHCRADGGAGLLFGHGDRRTRSLRRHVRRRQFRALCQDSDPAQRGGRTGDEPGIHGPAPDPEIRVPVADRAQYGRHERHGLGGRPDVALHGARAAIAVTLRGGLAAPRQREIDRGGPEVFRPGRAQLGSAAVWREPGLRLHRHHEFRGHHRRRRRPGTFRPAVGARLRDLGSGLQGLGRALPHVDAGCLRGRTHPRDRLLCHGPKGRGDGALCTGHVRCLWRDHDRLAADPGALVGALDVPGGRGRHRPARHQAADGLFVHRSYGLCAYGAGCGDRAGRAGDADLHGDLCGDECRHLRLHPVDAQGRTTRYGDRGSQHVCTGEPDPRAGHAGASVQPGGRAALPGLLRQVLRAARGL